MAIPRTIRELTQIKLDPKIEAMTEETFQSFKSLTNSRHYDGSNIRMSPNERIMLMSDNVVEFREKLREKIQEIILNKKRKEDSQKYPWFCCPCGSGDTRLTCRCGL